jgi:hypothetical protein
MQLVDTWSRPGRRGNAARKSTTSHEPEVIETRRGGDHLSTPSAAARARWPLLRVRYIYEKLSRVPVELREEAIGHHEPGAVAQKMAGF